MTAKALPPIPDGLSLPFLYAALRNLEVLYLADRAPVVAALGSSGMVPADFGGRACVSYNFQNYIGEFPDFVSIVQEIELNITAYPASAAAVAPHVDFDEFLVSGEPTKLLGNWRVHVPCDNDHAIQAGVELFGEPKFKTSFKTKLPSQNSPHPLRWSFACLDPGDAAKTIFSVAANLEGLSPAAADVSPITNYSMVGGKLVGCRWNILGEYDCYDLSHHADRLQMQLGESSHAMRASLTSLIGGASARAVRMYLSPPVASQARPYYV
jgi:hypothetical protein